ncbi:oligopeptide transport system substrate-binding protein [Paenibacillus cellulosilyticus]|uniref:Oligopeptide transport system substrate-binding protein n=1 Tax=Paenibacillus cellulosilyticus TaxID=375489 RepID=A0A2V2Z9M0_9BACL|nr:peptide ABC transporter substrate-binding protein [Paenibacillus cellulosilyticus]PWW08821.1 oligopeptide transport system substrate-binding protein [Paenibacillus cellulosilyticus]QKS48372.1 peptide ABC transporter substrate-binding protein [Paenibacillus cellulosilyticus]
MKFKLGLSSLAAVMAIVLLVSGCTPKDENKGTETGESGSGAATSKVFRMNISTEPPTLDPAQSQDQVSFTVLNGLYEGLTRKDENGQNIPGIAEKWDISEDGKTYTFHLREDAKWSNGDPVTAGDFEFAWKRALDPELKPEPSAYAYQLYYIVNAESYNTGKGATADQVGVKATDDHTLVVNLNSPTPYFLSLMSFQTFFPVHQSVKDNEAWAANASTIISNGPFKMGEWQKNTSIKIVPNENYYAKDDVKLAGVEFYEVADSATELSMYQTDQLDWAGKPTGEIPADQLESLKSSLADEFNQKGIASLYYYLFNTTEKPFNNEKIRKAFSMAISRKDITEKVTRAGELPAYGVVPPGIAGEKEEYRTEVPDTFFEENYDEAKKLLAEGMAEEGVTKLPAIKLTFNTNDNHKKIAEAIAEMWRTNLGVEVSIENQEWGVFLENRNKLNYQVARGGWGADYNDPMTYIDLFTSKSGNNNTGFASKEYDDLVAKAYASTDAKERMSLMSQAEKLLIDTRAIMPIYYYSDVFLEKKGFKGIFIDYKGDIDYTRGYYEG